MEAKRVESVLIKKLLFEDETGARVVLVVPRGGVALQEGGVLRNLSLGAISTTAMINDFKKARIKAQELKQRGVDGVSEITHGDQQERLKPVDPQEQATAALQNAEAPPVFVGEGEETKHCSCDRPMGTRRCLNCGLLINHGTVQ